MYFKDQFILRFFNHFLFLGVVLMSVALFGCKKEDKEKKADKENEKTQKTADGAILHKSAIKNKGEEKVYEIKAEKGQLLDFSLTNEPAASTPVAYTMEIKDPAGNRIVRVRDTHGSDGTVKLQTRVFASMQGEYKIHVYDWSKTNVDPSNPFELTIKKMEALDKNEPNQGRNIDGHRSLAAKLPMEKPVEGYIEFHNDEDWFKFEGKKNSIVDITLTNAPATSSPVKYTMEMWGSGNNKRIWRMRGGDGSKGTTVLKTRRYISEDGDYFLNIRDWNGDNYERKNPYKLTIKQVPVTDKNEPNNGANIDTSRRLATPIESGKTAEGLIGYQEDEDWYKIRIEKGKLLKIELTNAPATSSTVSYTLSMWNSKDQKRMWRLRGGDGGSGTTTIKTVAYVPIEDDYFLRVYDWDNKNYENKKPYKLAVEILENPDRNEPNNGQNFDASKIMATPLAEGKSIQGVIEYRNDYDWFVVDHKGGELAVSVANKPLVSSSVDFTLALHDENGKRLEREYNRDGSSGTTSLTLKKVVPAGKYYISVSDWSDDDFGLKEAYSLSYGGKPAPVQIKETEPEESSGSDSEKEVESDKKDSKESTDDK